MGARQCHSHAVKYMKMPLYFGRDREALDQMTSTLGGVEKAVAAWAGGSCDGRCHFQAAVLVEMTSYRIRNSGMQNRIIADWAIENKVTTRAQRGGLGNRTRVGKTLFVFFLIHIPLHCEGVVGRSVNCKANTGEQDSKVNACILCRNCCTLTAVTLAGQ